MSVEINELGKRWVFEFISAREEAEARLNELLFIEQDPTRSKAIELLADWEVSLPDNAETDRLADIDVDKLRSEADRFSSEVASLRRAAAGVRKLVGGAFSSERWRDQDIAPRRRLGP